MKNKKIKEHFDKFRAATKCEEVLNVAKDLGIPVPSELVIKNGRVGIELDKIKAQIYSMLQTEIMANTVKSANWSCFWAALAAISSLAAVIIALISICKQT